MARLRVGVDVGGTFTDIVVWDEESQRVHVLKTPSEPTEPAVGVARGVEAVLESAGAAAREITALINGTTVAVNTIIQRNGARVGLLVTQGFRDVLELRRVRLPGAPSFEADKPVALVPRRSVREVGERLRADGSVLRPIPWDDVEREVRALVADGVEAIAICFLHAYRNAEHEAVVKAWIAEHYPALYVCASTELWPQQREYERSLITVMNAYVGSRMQTYFAGLVERLAGLGVATPVLSTKSNGGVMSAVAAGRAPIQTLLSGPASGLIAALHLAQQAGHSHVVTFDMGGTSTDVGVVAGRIPYSTENTVGDFPVVLPSVDVTSIGAGGGSLLWVDEVGTLRVGPDSAGSAPGPACYGLGGTQPTITDCYVALGLIAPEDFLGGSFQLRPDLAREALGRVGAQLGLETLAVANAALDVATATMYAELLPLLASHGADRKDFALMPYGGAGPTHAFLLAEEAGFEHVIVPPSPGALCALGCILADFRADFVRTVYARLDGTEDRLTETFAALDDEAHAWLDDEEIAEHGRQLVRSADVRYVGQSYELTVELTPGSPAEAMASIPQRYAMRYAEVYGYMQGDAPLEIVNLRVQAVGATPKPELRAPGAESDETARPVSQREVRYGGAPRQIAVYRRADLAAGQQLNGPAIVTQYDTTTFVPAGFRLRVDDRLNLIGERV
ncbi:MAG TPA: hydantoinase/oxoprolinase family protein [Ktedonobacterales bacterium]|nr:hydantoinase/oxoprolinase family protein [Ktedonobacterales bacterium]